MRNSSSSSTAFSSSSLSRKISKINFLVTAILLALLAPTAIASFSDRSPASTSITSTPTLSTANVDSSATMATKTSFRELSSKSSSSNSKQPPPNAVMSADRCTAIVVGKKGSAVGHTMTTHTSDCAECDWRINKVPAQDWPAGSMRPIYLITGAYPRQVREDRGVTWNPDNLEDLKQKPQWEKMRGDIIGYIPQVKHTFALIEGMYGISNEHQVSIGESTCASKLYASPVGFGGTALLEASELSQIALERATTAREAITIMGQLAEEYGFYSAEWDVEKPKYAGESSAQGEGSEALTIIDPNEAWMFHISPDDTGKSAVWVAQRVPDNHISVVANQFVIRNIRKNDPNFMMSSNIYDVAKRMGWWDESVGDLNFLKTYAPTRYHPNYANRRVWRVFSLANPTLNLPISTNAYGDDYPFSVEVLSSKLLQVEDIMRMNRDHYEGTPFSTTDGLASGPYGDPNRYDVTGYGNMTARDAMEGEFPRTISLFRTSYSFVAVGRSEKPSILAMIWFSQYAPDMSSYSPIYISSETIPKPFIRGAMHKYSTESAWWNHAVVGNYVSRYYVFAVQTIRDLQNRLYSTAKAGVHTIESQIESSLLSGYLERKEIVKKLTDFSNEQGKAMSQAWVDIFPVILTTFRDGYVIGNQEGATISITKMFYPKYWLDAVGYWDIGGNKDGILFASNPATNSTWSVCLLFALGLICGSLITVFLGKNLSNKSSSRINNGNSYESISPNTMSSSVDLDLDVDVDGGVDERSHGLQFVEISSSPNTSISRSKKGVSNYQTM